MHVLHVINIDTLETFDSNIENTKIICGVLSFLSFKVSRIDIFLPKIFHLSIQ
jgi:hypothetical protein